MFLGPRGDPLSPTGQNDVRVKIESPVLNMQELKELQGKTGVKMTTLTTLYSALDALTIGGLEAELERLCDQAIEAVNNGATIINLSDLLESHEAIAKGYTGMTYISPLLAVGAVHHKLIEAGLRTKASIIVTTGQVKIFDFHQSL
jgi:glutamate synthase (ferredoxin)